MSDVQQAYNSWAQQYDSNENKTRDLEAKSLRETLAPLSFEHCLEIGCGTGKNTVWLMQKAATVTAADLSEEMLAKAKEKITSPNVMFVQADITQPWDFATKQFDLVGFSLVLEHIELLQPVMEKAAAALKSGGYLYISELHPFKQYNGSKARFETETGIQVVTCFNHHITDFTDAANANGLSLVTLAEYFDDDNRNTIPRLLTLLFVKK
ncbi:class I SAM-dependent methyltransferase [Lacibacter sediminis]|uniref:Class I SAM-dependent methyltransferase n=1 Tax=Lacibacter sediminis TaxID=2760713 RepID=A0A7G5XIK4_9BACT|nr:class I SAM-dependent methyltransferase [Lacibacter sediminis]QNA45307.1 class I SAM-dependent methyltransferase [Lacibacter sediminis]